MSLGVLHARTLWPGITILIGLLFSLPSLPARGELEDPSGWVLICSEESPLQGLTRRAASRLFLRQGEMLVGGRKVEPVNLESMKERLAFLSALTRLTPSLVERHFLELKFRREGDWPSTVSGPNQLIDRLRPDPNYLYVGWLRIETVEKLPPSSLKGLRLLKLDGKDHSSTEYDLRPR
ncbi:MAG: hypothetical protein P1V51_03720 [Deltaproteobacteria bacterium]|nr:hypothetical protein [Deltaproteobacteria bacterium]